MKPLSTFAWANGKFDRFLARSQRTLEPGDRLHPCCASIARTLPCCTGWQPVRR